MTGQKTASCEPQSMKSHYSSIEQRGEIAEAEARLENTER